MKLRRRPALAAVCFASLPWTASAAVIVPGDPLTGSGEVPRTLLTYAELVSPAMPPDAPVNDAAFALPAQAAMPRHEFSGTLTLHDPAANGSFVELRNDRREARDGDAERRHLPPLQIELAQSGSHLIPVVQGLAYTGSPYWNVIVGPGRVWSERGDAGWSRASLPFALIQRGQNCTHNGAMTFLFDDQRVSEVRYQITQESCLRYKFDLWGQIGATAARHAVAEGERLRREHAGELTRRLPTKPLRALLDDFPEAGVNLATFIRDIPSQQHITTWGLVVDGTHYVSNCPTRYGEYAFCAEMRLPSYSVAKSAFAGVALMRLGVLLGKAVYSAAIADHVPEHTLGKKWDRVTFDHAIDMATGHYGDAWYLRDEESEPERAFLRAETYLEKIRLAFEAFPPREAPGRTWVYHTNDTFILTQAMQNLLGRDVFDVLRDEVLVPLGVSKGGLTTLRTDNSATGRPFGGWGLFFNQDDIAKVASFLDRGDGKINNIPVLDAARVAESMFRAGDPGLPIADAPNVKVADTWRYGNGFWGKRMTPAEFPALSCEFMVSRMGGFGGISVVMMPNGTVFYVWSDHDEFGWYSAVVESQKLGPHC
jgi:CubicO group peptidase (beta-lactamase class C family)